MKVDVRGEICPYPMMMAMQAMKKAAADEVIEVYTDDAAALENIPAQAKRLGFTCNIDETGAGEWRITLAKAS